jgi:hypothetical protein
MVLGCRGSLKLCILDKLKIGVRARIKKSDFRFGFYALKKKVGNHITRQPWMSLVRYKQGLKKLKC